MTNSDLEKVKKQPKLHELLILFSLFIATAFSFIAIWDLPVQLVLLIALFLAVILGMKNGYSYNELNKAIKEGVHSGLDVLLILVVVGALIGTWIAGGVVPTIIYYGLDIINPSIFLLVTLLICSFTSLATGTSWGTAGTAGIALVIIGEGLGYPAPLVIGAVLSGAFFGDKLSPLSDSTIIAAGMAKVDIMEHVRSMLYVDVPALIISGIAFTIVGFNFSASNTSSIDRINEIMIALDETFTINLFMLLPAFIVIILLAMKKPAFPTIAFGALLGTLWTLFFQDFGWVTAIDAAYQGVSMDFNNEFLNELLNRGGIMSMMGGLIVILLGLSFGGILTHIGALQVISNSIFRFINSIGSLTASTMFLGFLGNALASATSVSLILTSKIMEDKYDELNVSRAILSRNMESGATTTAPMVPWCDSGVFLTALFGMSVFKFLPFLWLNFAVIIISLIYGYTNKFIWKQNEDNLEESSVS